MADSPTRPVRRALTCRARVMSALAFLLTLGGAVPSARVVGRGVRFLGPSIAHADTVNPHPQHGLCFRGHRDCAGFWITEARFGVRTDRTGSVDNEPQISVALGRMWRTGQRWAAGGAVFYQISDSDRWGADGRVRYWLGSETHVEAAAGVWLEDSPPARSRGLGSMVRAELGFGDSIGLWTELARRNTFQNASATEWRTGVSLDSYAGLAGGGLLVVLIVLYAISVGTVIQ